MLVSAVARRAGRRLEIIFWVGKGLAGHGVLRTVKGLVDLDGGYGCHCGGSNAAQRRLYRRRPNVNDERMVGEIVIEGMVDGKEKLRLLRRLSEI
jgi:hypothetical protein